MRHRRRRPIGAAVRARGSPYASRVVVTEADPKVGPHQLPVRAAPGVALRDGLVLSCLAIALLLQNPGRIRFDTKLDLTTDPWGFLARALSAWDPSAGFGQVQNQAYGYLWPMGPYFGVLHSLGVPVWIIQASWAWMILALAYLGTRVLATRLGFGWTSAAVAGLAYALAPRMLTVIGPLSAEALPAALLPFTLVPLARGSGRVARTAVLAALPVLMMGAANAALTLVTLPITASWILLRTKQGRWRLLATWLGFIVAFTAWWIVPLVVQGRYATPFLSYIESAQDTTGGLSPSDVLRGQVHWVSGIVDAGGAWWPAGFQYVSSLLLMATTLAVAGLGLLGLALPTMPARRVLIPVFLLGWTALVAGSAWAPGREIWFTLLDGALVPFRNVHKLDPMLRLPLALGLAATHLTVANWIDSRRGRRLSTARGLPRAWAVSVVGLILVSAAPLISPGITAGRTWTAVPSWWSDAASWVAREDPDGRALVVPGSGFGQYLWGRTIDEPMQPLARSAWAVDNGLPLGSPGSQRVLDSISAALRSGRPAPGLAETLARSGISHVIVRNDLDTGATLAPARARIAATLQASPGFVLRTGFGEVGSNGPGLIKADYARDAARPAIEIYRVMRPVDRVALTELNQVVTMTGGPEALLPAAAAGMLSPRSPVVFTEDSVTQGTASGPLITDGLARRERALGRGADALSSVLRADEEGRVRRLDGDIVPFAGPALTVATHRDVLRVDASTAQSFADALGPLRIERQPSAAVDGDSATWWQSSTFRGPAGQWWEVGLRRARDMRGLRIDLAQSPLIGSRVSTVRLSTERGAIDLDVPPTGRVGPIRASILDAAKTLRITAIGADGAIGDFAVREVALPELRPTRPLLVPPAPSHLPGPRGLVLASISPPIAACVLADGGTRCDPSGARPDGDGGVIDRLVQVQELMKGDLAVSAVIRSGAAAAALFDPIDEGIRARATSWLGDDVRVRPSAAVDGDLDTAWVADLTDSVPRFDLEWGTTRTITSVRLQSPSAGQTFAEPLAVTIRVGDRTIRSQAGSGSTILDPTDTRPVDEHPDRQVIPGDVGRQQHPFRDTRTGRHRRGHHRRRLGPRVPPRSSGDDRQLLRPRPRAVRDWGGHSDTRFGDPWGRAGRCGGRGPAMLCHSGDDARGGVSPGDGDRKQPGEPRAPDSRGRPA